MSFEINGETWEPQSAIQHATAIIENINKLLQENNITDKDGNLIQLKPNYGNAMYLLSLGDGQRFAENDEKLSKAINSFNIELCDDQQIENLLPIAAVTRNPGSYSTLRLTVTASGDGACTIPAGTKAPYGNVNFVVQETAVISAGATQVINTVCDTIGPVAVLTGEVTAFESTIANLESVINNESSVPGVAKESTNSLRRRLIAGDTIKFSINGCKSALEELTGVTYARVYFNYNTSSVLELPGGVEIQPRTAYIVIHGSSDKIAEVYSEFMSAPTQNAPGAAGASSTVNVTVKASSDGSATLPNTTTVTYDGHTFTIDEAHTIAAGGTEVIEFICDEVGPINVPSLGITHLDQEITNVESAMNMSPAVPGYDNPAHEQDWISASGQSIPIYYDDASEKNVFVKVVLEEDAESGTQVENQIKRDLIVASAGWKIGESVTQLLTCEPFVNCTYTKVAYTQISDDGVTWSEVLDVGCNVIPRVADATIRIEQIGD